MHSIPGAYDLTRTDSISLPVPEDFSVGSRGRVGSIASVGSGFREIVGLTRAGVAPSGSVSLGPGSIDRRAGASHNDEDMQGISSMPTRGSHRVPGRDSLRGLLSLPQGKPRDHSLQLSALSTAHMTTRVGTAFVSSTTVTDSGGGIGPGPAAAWSPSLHASSTTSSGEAEVALGFFSGGGGKPGESGGSTGMNLDLASMGALDPTGTEY